MKAQQDDSLCGLEPGVDCGVTPACGLARPLGLPMRDEGGLRPEGRGRLIVAVSVFLNAICNT